MINFPKKKRGISLLEIMLSLVIISLLLVMATRYYGLVRLQQQTNDAAGEIQAIRAAAERWLVGHTDYTGISVSALQQLNLLPQNFATNPWGDAVTVTASGGNAFKITLKKIPFAACNNLLDRFQNQLAPPAPAICANPISGDDTDFVGVFN